MVLVVKNPLAKLLLHYLAMGRDFPGAVVVNARDEGSVPGVGRSPGGGHGNPLQYSCLEKPMNRGAWRATVHGVANRSLEFP